MEHDYGYCFPFVPGNDASNTRVNQRCFVKLNTSEPPDNSEDLVLVRMGVSAVSPFLKIIRYGGRILFENVCSPSRAHCPNSSFLNHFKHS
ncbi:hypothetical protein JAAARDRAFT_501843 [Jaapia argillacea MUCL 33604]|uniref:Uncharacterized protein n=1 Tax=Jaapia argillacea MUCL 33604 TaxID=933084 RepID=A0A067P9R9_9AGAM|nr:hypothetical protein JAAARDRAFT_501843 [Jaapia argillacea MUCL 33604]